MKNLLRLFLLVGPPILLAGCYSSDRFNQLQLGMTRAQVTTVMGPPDSTSRQANVEYLTYYLEPVESGMFARVLDDLRVGMTQDQVEAILGRPSTTSAEGDVVYLTYQLFTQDPHRRTKPFVVRLVKGKTESFGRLLQLDDLYNRGITGSPQPVIDTSELSPAEAAFGADTPYRPRSGGFVPYMVRLVDGRVESFGRFSLLDDIMERQVTSAYPGEADFPSPGGMMGVVAGPPSPSFGGASPPPAAGLAPFDLAAKLQTLQNLKDQGVLSPEQFQEAKARLLAP